MTKLDGKTPDLAAENIKQLRQIFPDVFEEGKIDFDTLLTHHVPFDRYEDAYRLIEEQKDKAMKVMIDMF